MVQETASGTYGYHQADEVHEFVFYVKGTAMVDWYLDMLVQEVVPRIGQRRRERVLFLLDMSDTGMYPLSYFSRQYAKFIENMPPLPQARLAYIFGTRADMALGSQMGHYYRGERGHHENHRRFYLYEQRDEAFEWLRLAE